MPDIEQTPASKKANMVVPQPAAETPVPMSPARRRLRHILLLIGPLLVVSFAVYFYLTSARFVTTDNAYVKADIVSISPQVSGLIKELDIAENQFVSKGQVLFKIDDRPYRIALAHEEANLAQVYNDILAQKSLYREKEDDLQQAEADLAFYKREYERQTGLARQSLNSKSQLDQASHTRDVAEFKVVGLRQELTRVLAGLDGNADLPVEQHSAYHIALTQHDQAVLDLERTVVTAPMNGSASKIPEQGDYVSAGTPMMSLVAINNVWIEANFKETELTHVTTDQPVTIHLDTYPDHKWNGQVQSISQATGAEFSVLPPQNATGNWVKVVQRIPVRITLQNHESQLTIRAGMSAHVEIDTGYFRPLPGVIKTSLNWFDRLTGRPPTALADIAPSL